MNEIETKWEQQALDSSSLVFDQDYRVRIEEEFRAAKDWRIKYELLEQELVRSMPEAPPLAPDDADEGTKSTALNTRNSALSDMQLPSSDRVLDQMTMRNYTGPAYYHAGLVAAEPPPWQFLTGGSPYLWAMAGIGSVALYFLSRKVANVRRRRRY